MKNTWLQSASNSLSQLCILNKFLGLFENQCDPKEIKSIFSYCIKELLHGYKFFDLLVSKVCYFQTKWVTTPNIGYLYLKIFNSPLFSMFYWKSHQYFKKYTEISQWAQLLFSTIFYFVDFKNRFANSIGIF